MYELIQVGPQSYYIQSPAKIGVYVPDGQTAYLIDSGNDKDAGRRVRKVLDQNGWQLKGILTTHSNADHIGGCKYLQDNTGCKVYAPPVESAFTEFPELEPAFLYGGYPCKDLRHKFLMAQPCETVPLTHETFPREVQIIDLPGHFFRMVGYLTPDGTFFSADCLSSEATLEKYGLSFLYDVRSYLDTLDKVSAMEVKCFVPAHAEATGDLTPLAEKNKAKVLEIGDHIVRCCAAPLTFEELLRRLFLDYGLTMTFEQYVLIGSTVRSYLSWLKEQGRVGVQFEDCRMLWYAVK